MQKVHLDSGEGQGHLSIMYDHANDMVTKALTYF